MNRYKNHLFLTVSIMVALTGCSLYNINSEDITADYYPSKKAADVVYVENIGQPHEVIGYVTVNAERRQEVSEVMEKIKREAAVIGGDAITNIKTDASGAWKKLPAQKLLGNAYIRANFSATVVVFK